MANIVNCYLIEISPSIRNNMEEDDEATEDVDGPGLPVMDPGELVGYGEMDQAEAVEETKADDEGDLPEEDIASNNCAGNVPNTDTKTHHTGTHDNTEIGEECKDIDQFMNSLKAFLYI